MLEFFLSKMWLFLAGFALIGAVTSAFTQLNGDMVREDMTEVVADLSEAIEGVNGSPRGTTLTVRMDSLLGPDRTAVVTNGSVWVEWSRGRVAAECSAEVVLLDGEATVDRLAIGLRDRLILTKSVVEGRSVTVVQLEKVETISLTTSTSLLASSSVLYT